MLAPMTDPTVASPLYSIFTNGTFPPPILTGLVDKIEETDNHGNSTSLLKTGPIRKSTGIQNNIIAILNAKKKSLLDLFQVIFQLQFSHFFFIKPPIKQKFQEEVPVFAFPFEIADILALYFCKTCTMTESRSKS